MSSATDRPSKRRNASPSDAMTPAATLTPTESATKLAKTNMSSLHHALQMKFKEIPLKIITLLPRIDRLRAQIKRVEDNDDYLPNSLRIQFKLIVSAAVSQTQTFKDEAASVKQALTVFQQAARESIIKIQKEELRQTRSQLVRLMATTGQTLIKSMVYLSPLTVEAQHTSDYLWDMLKPLIKDATLAQAKLCSSAELDAAFAEYRAPPDSSVTTSTDQTSLGQDIEKTFTAIITAPMKRFYEIQKINDDLRYITGIDAINPLDEATAATAMNIGAQPAVDHATLDTLIDSSVSRKMKAERQRADADRKRLEQEIRKLKNAQRGASKNRNRGRGSHAVMTVAKRMDVHEELKEKTIDELYKDPSVVSKEFLEANQKNK